MVYGEALLLGMAPGTASAQNGGAIGRGFIGVVMSVDATTGLLSVDSKGAFFQLVVTNSTFINNNPDQNVGLSGLPTGAGFRIAGLVNLPITDAAGNITRELLTARNITVIPGKATRRHKRTIAVDKQGDLLTTLDDDFCAETLREALSKGKPKIFNTDQGSQFTSEAFTGRLLARGIQVSMDGRGRCMDNVFVERLWQSVKYEEVYLKAYQNGSEARRGIGAYLAFYNQERPHQALGYQTPGQVFQEKRPERCLLEHTGALSSLAGTRDIPAVDSSFTIFPMRRFTTPGRSAVGRWPACSSLT